MIINSKIILIPFGLALAFYAFGWTVCKIDDLSKRNSIGKEKRVKA